MSLPSAIVTNSITNGLHAFILLTYFILSCYQYKKGKIRSPLIVYFFLFFFTQKSLAVLVHYYVSTLSVRLFDLLWMMISVNSFCLIYCVLYSIEIPKLWRRSVLGIAFVANLIFCVQQYFDESSFALISLASALACLVAAFFSRGLARTAFIWLILSNLVWIGLRAWINSYHFDATTFVDRAYDNDIYHLLLIVSTSFLYFSIVRKEWNYPKKAEMI